MSKLRRDEMPRRERQIMDILFRKGEATVSEVLAELSDPPSYSAVRATLGVLEEKGFVRHRKAGRRFTYTPTMPRTKAGRSALKHMINTFFDGSAEGAVAALLELESARLTPDALDRLGKMIDEARKEGR